MSVGQVGEMSAVEEDYWIARSYTEPFAAKRMEYYLAQIAYWIFNTHVEKKDSRKLSDFLMFRPKVEEKPEPQLDTKTIRSNFNSFIERQNVRRK